MIARGLLLAVWLPALAWLAGCGNGDALPRKAALPAASGASPAAAAPTDSAVAQSVAWTGVTNHPRHLQAGQVVPADTGGNPYATDANAVKTGAALFLRYNCDGCHGDGAAGSVGPSLDDGRWRYGGTPREVYQSIYEGRPLGMPSYKAVAREPIWYLVTYVRSLHDSTINRATQNTRVWATASAPPHE
ncbi:MAG: c-type cytochrome [Gemmatimonadota bacterium]